MGKGREGEGCLKMSIVSVGRALFRVSNALCVTLRGRELGRKDVWGNSGGKGWFYVRGFHSVVAQPWFALDRLIVNQGAKKKVGKGDGEGGAGGQEEERKRRLLIL